MQDYGCYEWEGQLRIGEEICTQFKVIGTVDAVFEVFYQDQMEWVKRTMLYKFLLEGLELETIVLKDLGSDGYFMFELVQTGL